VRPSRRQVLAAGAVAVVASCSRERTPDPVVPHPDDALREAAIAREQALVEAYGGAMRTHPSLVARLAPLLGDHAAHLAALGRPAATPAEASPVTTLRALQALERTTAGAHAAAAATASRDLAPLLASLAACESVHAAVLA